MLANPIRIWLVCAVFSLSGPALAVDLEYLPKGRAFHLTFADPREVRMAMIVGADQKIHTSVGNYFSLIGLSGERDLWKAHLGLEGAGYFTMYQADRRFPLETIDGLIGLYGEIQWRNIEAQLRFTHISAHLSDGITAEAFPYSRETLALRVGWTPSELSLLYGGVYLLTNSVPPLPALFFQVGGSSFFPIKHTLLAPFLAFDLKWRRDSSYDPSLQLQLGVAFNQPPEAYRSFRLYYSYYTGADPRGQFYSLPLTTHALGIEMQI